MTLEKSLYLGELFLRDPDVFTIFQEERPSQVVSSEIIGIGTDQTTAKTKFRATSILFNGSTDYLSVYPSTSFMLGTASTFETWVYPTSMAVESFIFSMENPNTTGGGAYLKITTGGQLVFGSIGSVSGIVTTTNTILVNTWTHIACTVNSGTVSIYLNGVLNATSVGQSMQDHTGNVFYIGCARDTTGLFTGYIDELRVSNIDRYAGVNFKPSQIAYGLSYDPYWNKVLLLLSFDGTHGNREILDLRSLNAVQNDSMTVSSVPGISKYNNVRVRLPNEQWLKRRRL